MSNVQVKTERQSGIELMKVIAILMIVLSHAAQSFGNASVGYEGLPESTYDLQRLCLIFFRQMGQIGNLMFLIPSAWFLADSKKVNFNKIARFVADTFTVSAVWLICYAIGGGALTASDIIRSLFPTTLGVHWYITCYLLLYAIHPLLNLLIDRIDRKTHFAYSIVFFVLYFVISFIKLTFFSNSLIGFVGVYFIVAYCKKYMIDLFSSKKANRLLFAAGFIGWIGLVLLINLLGRRIAFFHNKEGHLNTFINPLFLIMVFAAFNLFRISSLQNKTINAFSSLSLLIYIIHGNHLFREHIRPIYYDYIYAHFTYDHLLVWVLLYAVLMFIASLLLAILYNKLLQPLVHKLADKLLAVLLKLYGRFEAAAMRLK
ncbi:MAG: acyltransferase [Bacteroides sp.]|nr:acyltransferase [Eubacterium sp.]MCM1417402.1 acyltransferase [Roseburia sp.]MCM1461405.1 acyltransferase [Bacteroides sp.]